MGKLEAYVFYHPRIFLAAIFLLTVFFASRIPYLEMYSNFDIEKAREAAVAADHRIARGEPLGPLHGIPMTVKEAFDIVGMPSTWGVPALAESYPARNAHVVDRLVGAGAIILGKTNVPAWLIIKQRSWSLLRLHLCPTQRSIPFLRHMSWAYRCSKYCCGDQHGNTDKGFNTNGTFEAVSRTGAV